MQSASIAMGGPLSSATPIESSASSALAASTPATPEIPGRGTASPIAADTGIPASTGATGIEATGTDATGTDATGISATDTVRALARRLHRAARSETLSIALPVLRRLLAHEVLRSPSLPQLFRDRQTIQRKHLLQLLAIEAGHPHWEGYAGWLRTQTPAALQHPELLLPLAGYPNHWYADPADAIAHAARSGGRVVRVGAQAVVIPGAG